MNPRSLAHAEPAARASNLSDPHAGLARLSGALDLARQWAGEDRLALIVSGSHASGEAAWTVREGRPVTLSDLDVYVVVRDREARRAAIKRARAARPGLRERLLALGLEAPLEVGFHTPRGLAALPPRPATLELRRWGRVVDGDPAVLERVPRWTALEVPPEEVWLLLENRAFELLWAAHAPTDTSPLTDLRRRHAVLKCALDLASVMALAAGRYPESAAGRVAWARPRWDRAHAPEPPWDAALAWRRGGIAALAPCEAAEERLCAVRAWVSLWRRLANDPGDPVRPFGAIARVARRARLRRRLRVAVWPGPHEACGEPAVTRLRRALAGTPQHRLNAAAAARLLFEGASAEAAERSPGALAPLELGYRRVLRELGFHAAGANVGAALVRAWDRGLLDGQRTEGWT